jgi:hypothetical protein
VKNLFCDGYIHSNPIPPQPHIHPYHYNNAGHKPNVKNDIAHANMIVNKSKIEPDAGSGINEHPGCRYAN